MYQTYFLIRTQMQKKTCRTPSPRSMPIDQNKEKAMTNDVKAIEEEIGCCGGPAADGVDACCVKDADAKAAGEDGCGCNSTVEATEPEPVTACC